MSTKKFSELVQTENKERADQVIHHPLFTEIAKGTLPLETFKRFISQDHWYMIDYHKSYNVNSAKETDKDRKAQLLKKSQGSSSYAMFSYNYKKFNFTISNDIARYTKDYTDFLLDTAINGVDVGEGVAARYPCFLVWHWMGVYIGGIPKNPRNPYQYYLEKLTSTDFAALDEATDFVDGYYERADEPTKQRMLKNWTRGVEHELKFCDGVYNGTTNP